MSFSENFINIVDKLAEQFGIIIDWSNKNIMPYIIDLANRIVDYEFATSIMWSIIFLIATYICVLLIKKGIKIDKEDYYGEGSIFIIIGGALGVFCIFGLIFQILDIITCLFIPEKTLLYHLKIK